MSRLPRILPRAVFLLALGAASATASDPAQHDAIYGYLAGTYEVIGRALDGNETFSGRVVLEVAGGRLQVTRTIAGETVRGTGTIEHALGPDAADVLRVRFTRGGQAFAATYLWRSDLDNYPRLTGYLYRPGGGTRSPGLEALFIEHPAPEEP